jgi:AcrR family transcriptional regulator
MQSPRLRRRLEPKARRQEILEAAERVLRRLGREARVDDVVGEAGAAKGTFYLYFASWDDLLEAVRARVYADFNARYPAPAAGQGPVDWLAAFDALAEAFVDFALGIGRLHEPIFDSDFSARRPPAPGDNAVTRIAGLIRAGQAAGDFDAAVDPGPTARLLLALLHESLYAVQAGEDRGRAMAAASRMMRRTLAA